MSGEFDPFIFENPQPRPVVDPAVAAAATPVDPAELHEATIVNPVQAAEPISDALAARSVMPPAERSVSAPVQTERRGLRRAVGVATLATAGLAVLLSARGGEGNESASVENISVSKDAPVVSKFEQGDHPCGRTITREELQNFYASHPDGVATNPTEANAFLSEHPNLKTSMLGFFDQHYNGLVDWVNTHKDKTSKDLKDIDGDRMNNFENRLEVVQLSRDFTAVNHSCNPETGEIKDLGPQTFQAGDFVYGFTLKSEKELNEFMKKSGLDREDLLLTTVNIEDDKGDVHERPFVITNRGTCDNPLTPPPMHFETTITTGGSTTVVTVTSTIPSTTTSEVTTTTAPSTTIPHSGPKQGAHNPGGAPNDHVEASEGPDVPPTTILHQGGGNGGGNTSTSLKAPGTTAKPPETTNPPSSAPTVVSTTAPDRGIPNENQIP